MANYEYIVSSLQHYSFDSDTKGFDALKLAEELKELLSERDILILKELWWFFDLRNILQLRSGHKPVYSPLANLTEEEVVRINRYYSGEISEEEVDSEPLAELPDYAYKVLEAYREGASAAESEIDTKDAIEKTMWSSYYEATFASKNRFIREWNQFDLNVRNISAAFSARQKGVDIESVVIGNNDITELLITNRNVQDFGLKNEFAEIDDLLSLLSDENMLSKEQRLDKMRWNKIEELTTFDYFNIEHILGYMVEITLLERWSLLTESHGREVLDRVVESLMSKDKLKKEA